MRSESSSAGADGDSAACHSVSSARRLPTPASTDWSSNRAFTADRPRPTRARKSVRLIISASGPSASRSGSSRTRPSLRLSNRRNRPPSAKTIGEAVPLGLARGAVRTHGLAAAALPRRVGDDQPPAHAEVDAEVRAGCPGASERLAPHRLAPPVRHREPAPDQRCGDLARRVRAAHPVVGVVDRGDLAVQRVDEHAARALHLGQLGHRPILARRRNSRAPSAGSPACDEDPGARARAARAALAEHRRRRAVPRRPPRQDRPARLLDVLLRQLPARARRAPGAGGALRRRAGDDRRALAEVRARGGPGRRRGRGGALRRAPPRARRPGAADVGRLRGAGVADARRDRPAGLRGRADVRRGPRARARRADRGARRASTPTCCAAATARTSPRRSPRPRCASPARSSRCPTAGSWSPTPPTTSSSSWRPTWSRSGGGSAPARAGLVDGHRAAVRRAAGAAPAPGRRRAGGRQRQPRPAPGPAGRRRRHHGGGHRRPAPRAGRAGSDRGQSCRRRGTWPGGTGGSWSRWRASTSSGRGTRLPARRPRGRAPPTRACATARPPRRSSPSPRGSRSGDGVLWVADAETSALREVRQALVATAVGQGLFDFGHRDGPADRGAAPAPARRGGAARRLRRGRRHVQRRRPPLRPGDAHGDDAWRPTWPSRATSSWTATRSWSSSRRRTGWSGCRSRRRSAVAGARAAGAPGGHRRRARPPRPAGGVRPAHRPAPRHPVRRSDASSRWRPPRRSCWPRARARRRGCPRELVPRRRARGGAVGQRRGGGVRRGRRRVRRLPPLPAGLGHPRAARRRARPPSWCWTCGRSEAPKMSVAGVTLRS